MGAQLWNSQSGFKLKKKHNIQRFTRIYDENLLGRKSEPISVRFLFSIVIDLYTKSQNLLELHDFTILLRSNGNQA